MDTLYEVFLTRAEPSSIGLSSVGARLAPVSLADEGGLHYALSVPPEEGEDQTGGSIDHSADMVLAPVAPGKVAQVTIAGWRRLATGQRVTIDRRRCTVALDGERAFTVTPRQQLEIELQRNGPRVVDVNAALGLAAEQGLFRG